MNGRRAAPSPPGLQVLLALLLTLGLTRAGQAQELDFQPGAADDATFAIRFQDLASRILPVYQESDSERYLANLSALQLVTGNFTGAWSTRQSLLERRRRSDAGRPVQPGVVYDLYARARAVESQERLTFAQGYARAFQEIVPHLNDPDAYVLDRWLRRPVAAVRQDLLQRLDGLRGRSRIDTAAALDLIWAWLAYDAWRSFGPLGAMLENQDEHRRYIIEDDLGVRLPDGAQLPVTVVRPHGAGPLPALLEFTLNADPRNDPMESAAHGYAGVFALARSSRRGRGQVVVFQHDGADARAVIEWIARQDWNDGRVAMYGSRYSGFTAWAAAGRGPKALRAIAVADPIAPGIDFPMRGGIFRTGAFRWIFDATNAVAPDDTDAAENVQWRALEQRWYQSGRPFRDLDALQGTRSEIFHGWLDHPDYDRYWRSTMPYARAFSHIDIPVLTVTGYYAAGSPGALYYFEQHTQYDPHADHTLLAGPWPDSATDGMPQPAFRGYTLDPAALLDLHELRFQWFDYVFRRGSKPAVLAGRVNHELMGANEWHHDASLAAMAAGTVRYFLDPSPGDGPHRLLQHAPAHAAFLRQSVNLADRADDPWPVPDTLVVKAVAPRNSLVLVSDPLPRTLDISGRMRGHLELAVGRRDLDLTVGLYEQLADGECLQLFDPAYEFRASYAHDRGRRRLLPPGVRTQVDFTVERLTSRRLAAGSRLLVVLGVNKRANQEINYGTGGDVSRESVADARTPLTIRWYGGSYVELPVR